MLLKYNYYDKGIRIRLQHNETSQTFLHYEKRQKRVTDTRKDLTDREKCVWKPSNKVSY